MKTNPKNILALILVGAFLFSIAYAFYFRIEPTVDADAYDAIAINLVAGNGYVENTEIPLAEDSAIGRVGPGYQFFLFLVYKIFGHHYPVVWMIQALLHVLTGGMLFLIASKLFKERGQWIGLIASALYVFYIDVLQMNAMIMTESLFLFLTALSIYFFVLFYERPSKANALLLGVATALCILTRPTALLLLVMYLIFAVSKKYFVQALILALCFTFIIGPWTSRNYRVYDRFIMTTAAGGYDIWVGNNPEASGELEASATITAYLDNYGVEAADKKGIEEVKKFILTEPLNFIRLQLIKTSIYFSAARPSAFWFHLSGTSKMATVVLSSIFAFVTFALGFAGLWLAFKKRGIFRWLAALTLAAPVAVIPIIVETRYRFPIYPLMALFAAYFVHEIYQSHRATGKFAWTRELKIFAVTASVVMLNTVFDAWRNFDVVKDKLGL
ncbi:MAG: glycosyltransferase family 39 protein [Candidatus Taylorbacteria bacterium]|nr:glycosyltransferase family 39 protein [Candidatus Taylorbacteria bacterium]